MNWLDELVADVAARLRRRPPQRWLLRSVMLICGAAAQVWLNALGAGSVLQALGWAVLLLGFVLPRTVVPLVAGVFIVFEAAVVRVDAVTAVPIALGLAGWHVCAAALTTGRPWARLSRRVLRGTVWWPALLGLGGVAVAVPMALVADGLVLPEIAAVTLLLVVAVVLGAVVVLWPEPTADTDRATAGH